MKRKKTLIWYIIIAAALVVIGAGAILWCVTNKPKADPDIYTVTFKDHDGTVLGTEEVRDGEAATAPDEPSREDHTFVSWDKDFSEITEDTVIKAEYLNDTTTLFTVEKVTVGADATKVDVRVSVTNNPGILGMVLSVNYGDQLKLVDASTGSALSRLSFQKPSNYADGCRFLWYGSETGDVVDGDVLVLTFEIPATAEAGEYPISLSWDSRDIYDSEYDMINAKVVNGAIKVSN